MEKIEFSRCLRRAMTPAEKRLWHLLRRKQLGFYFRRQVPRGPYVLDFVCLERRLVVELDGSQHADSVHDARRDAWLTTRGFRVLRFWNQDLLFNPDGVLRAIESTLHEPFPLLPDQ